MLLQFINCFTFINFDEINYQTLFLTPQTFLVFMKSKGFKINFGHNHIIGYDLIVSDAESLYFVSSLCLVTFTTLTRDENFYRLAHTHTHTYTIHLPWAKLLNPINRRSWTRFLSFSFFFGSSMLPFFPNKRLTAC